ncbi:MAG: multicopper oxidase domain-containing protein, partial [Phycisphaeraceae bacterium]|nr:multicopper oxidase domain-containing protein [Phycisphaeraceae bacterium]
LRAEVGDTIKVHFLNRGKQPYSIHPHGLFYTKDHEGAPYAGIPGKGHAITPGQSHVYEWSVPKRAGPGPNDPSSVVWPYHSHVDTPADVNAGLVGAIVVTKKGAARADGSPSDVDLELFNLYLIFDENKEGQEEEGHLMHAINGYVFGNLPGMQMKVGQRVRWYLIGLGNEVDLHTPHWHAATVLHEGQRKDVINLLPAAVAVADMVPDAPGRWMLHCHVSDHVKAGMSALYDVKKQDP